MLLLTRANECGSMDFVSDAFFNDRYRTQSLDTHWFLSLPDARENISARRTEKNQSRPHTSLGYRPADKYAQQTGFQPFHEGKGPVQF